MTAPPSEKFGDEWTVIAIGVIAMCIATAAHEAIGHGSACLALGGRITQLTSVYFQCSARSTWIAAGGPLGNLAAALLAWLGLVATPRTHAQTRLFCLVVLLISLFWFAGYLIYAAAFLDGDPYFVALDLMGPPVLATRAAMILGGVACYLLGIFLSRRMTARIANASQILRTAWAAASVAAFAAALFYTPDRGGATKQALLEIGAASFPMMSRVIVGVRRPDAQPVDRSPVWIGAGVLAFGVFAATLGRGR
ncbi:MAG: hypothetical protein ABUS57_04460 [Pseudomonadota bacterium]